MSVRGRGVPKNFAREYAATWLKQAKTFKLARTAMEKLIREVGDAQAEPGEAFKTKIDKLENDVAQYKKHLARFKALDKSYKGNDPKGKAEADADAEGD